MEIDIRHIRLVETLARQKNFARVVKELHMTQPGLSRAIQSLEDNLGVKLFDRQVREVTSTHFGEHIIKVGVPLLKDAQRLKVDVEYLKKVSMKHSPAMGRLKSSTPIRVVSLLRLSLWKP